MPFSVHRIDGLIYGQGRRDVAFLESSEDAKINAKQAFDALKIKHQTEMRNKFELWRRNEQHHNLYFHGFPGTDDKECFVFKRKHAGTYYRYYGFLINPRPLTDASYRLCILVLNARKNREHTDPNDLKFVNAVRLNPQVIAAVKKEFPEKQLGGSQWNITRR